MQELPLNGFYESTTPRNSKRRCVNLIPINEPNGSLSTNMLECPAGIDGPISSSIPAGLMSQSIHSQVFEWVNNRNSPVIFCADNQAVATNGFSVITERIPTTAASAVPNMFGARFASSPNTLVAVNKGDTISAGVGVALDKDFNATLIDFNDIFNVGPSGIVDVAFLGGRFIYANGQSSGSLAFRCYYSEIGGVEPLETNFFQPDMDSTEFTGLHVLNGQLWLFDRKRSYLFSLTGSTSTPFSWQRSATVNAGLYSPHAKAESNGVLFMIAGDESGNWRPVVFAGGSISPIGSSAVDHAINQDLKKGAKPTQVKVFAYHEQGRDFVAFTTGHRTFVYNVNAKRWFERDSGDGYWRAIGFAGRDAEVFVGDRVEVDISAEWRIGRSDYSIGTEFGSSIERLCDTAPFNANNSVIKLSELEPVCDVVGSETQSVSVSLSTDYGATFGTERQSVIDGASRARFTSWGAIRQAFVVRLRFTSDYPTKIVKLLARMVTGGRGT